MGEQGRTSSTYRAASEHLPANRVSTTIELQHKRPRIRTPEIRREVPDVPMAAHTHTHTHTLTHTHLKSVELNAVVALPMLARLAWRQAARRENGGGRAQYHPSTRASLVTEINAVPTGPQSFHKSVRVNQVNQ